MDGCVSRRWTLLFYFSSDGNRREFVENSFRFSAWPPPTTPQSISVWRKTVAGSKTAWFSSSPTARLEYVTRNVAFTARFSFRNNRNDLQSNIVGDNITPFANSLIRHITHKNENNDTERLTIAIMKMNFHFIWIMPWRQRRRRCVCLSKEFKTHIIRVRDSHRTPPKQHQTSHRSTRQWKFCMIFLCGHL